MKERAVTMSQPHFDGLSAPSRPSAKSSGYVETPPRVVRQLVDWAVKTSASRVLDAGFGDGRFLKAVAERLKALGASPPAIAQQLYGVEIDRAAYERTAGDLASHLGHAVEHLRCADFALAPPWTVDAVVGNPPYVRRQHLENLSLWAGLSTVRLSALTDLSALFVMQATQLLEPGGRLAVIVSGGWLDEEYGREFRNFLSREYAEIQVVGYTGRVFPDVLVRPVAIMATKGERVRGVGIELRVLDGEAKSPSVEPRRLITADEFQGDAGTLSSKLYHPSGVKLLDRYGLSASTLGDTASVRIGFQSFAKGFYLLSSNRVSQLGLAQDYLRPIVLSPRWLPDKLHLRKAEVPGRAFWAKNLESLDEPGKCYLEAAEREPIGVRGKGYEVQGYQEAPRLKKARRTPWFNIVTELESRGGREILIPRRTFVRYQVMDNADRIPATEDFLEVSPCCSEFKAPLLVYLNSTFGEVAVRLASHQYGGGVYNLNPSQARAIRIPAIERLTVKADLVSVWDRIKEVPFRDARPLLDDLVPQMLDLPLDALEVAGHVLHDLHGAAKLLARPSAS